ncbi:MAG TPA: glycosyltransferase family 4 protein [Gallionellaceae bacterium]|nr:glycosyltransferase family 4 protein [Gallionellaceae bacterium]
MDTFLVNLFNAWTDLQDDLVLVCNSSHPGLETIAERTVHPLEIIKYDRIFTSKIAQGRGSLYFSQSFPVRAFFVLAYRVLQYPILFPWYLFTLTLFFKRSDFDRLIVVNGGYPASLLGRCAAIAWRLSGKKPFATFNFHNSAINPPWYFSLMEYLIDVAVIRSVRQFVSVSKDCLGSLRNLKAFMGCTKMCYIYNGIEDPKLVSNGFKDDSTNQYANERYCLMLATYESRKGHVYLLQAFQMVIKDFPDVRLRIYGYGKPHEKKRVADEVQRLELGRHVFLNDFTANTTSLIANASVLVVPSQSHESFGLTIIEAMAFGVPVVTTDVGGMPEVLADSGAGYVCSKEVPESFAEAIKIILGDPALASDLGLKGRQAFEQRFTADMMARNYRRLIE